MAYQCTLVGKQSLQLPRATYVTYSPAARSNKKTISYLITFLLSKKSLTQGSFLASWAHLDPSKEGDKHSTKQNRALAGTCPPPLGLANPELANPRLERGACGPACTSILLAKFPHHERNCTSRWKFAGKAPILPE